MAAALVALLIARRPWRIPPVWVPLSLFMLGTLVSLAASGHASEGLPQVRKFYVYLMLFLVTSAFETARQIRWVALGWTLAAALSSLWAIKQLLQSRVNFFESEYHAAGQPHPDFYAFYIDARVTGFMGHWMTLGGELMMALLLIGALVFFAHGPHLGGMVDGGRDSHCRGARSHLDAQHVVGRTLRRRIFDLVLETVGAADAAPAHRIRAALVNPLGLRERAFSAVAPHPGQTDSNAHRAELRRIGWEMIKAHPWLGVGPEQVSRQYRDYIRPDMPAPRVHRILRPFGKRLLAVRSRTRRPHGAGVVLDDRLGFVRFRARFAPLAAGRRANGGSCTRRWP